MEVNENELKAAKVQVDILSDLHSVFKPHEGQIPIGRALFYENKKTIMVECGRKFGKTDILCYALYRWAMTNPSTYSYYIAPFKDQIKDLVWSNGRLPMFLPPHLAKKYIHSVNNTEMRIVFKNGSFIKCDGSDNYEKGRGYSATGMVAYDEFKDHNPNFHNAFEPNLAITDAPLLGVGTPSYEDDNIFTRIGDFAKTSKIGAYFSFPSHMNPYISKEYLERKEQEFRDRGEYDIFELEYLAKRVNIGSKYIFPMLKKSMVRSHDELILHITRNRKDYDFFTGYDPGSAKCFAVGMFAVHRFEKHIIALDEVYVTKLGENSVRKIVPVALNKIKEINPNNDDWLSCYDHAAAWFASEISSEYPDYPHPLFPCQKDLKNKEAKLSLIKDLLNKDLMIFSDRVEKGFWEMDNYKLDDNGKIVKENDHWIDLFRYVLNLANYSTIEGARPLSFTEKYKTGTIEQDLWRDKAEDLYGDIDLSLYDT
jgi:hypothetical protein